MRALVLVVVGLAAFTSAAGIFTPWFAWLGAAVVLSLAACLARSPS